MPLSKSNMAVTAFLAKKQTQISRTVYLNKIWFADKLHYSRQCV